MQLLPAAARAWYSKVQLDSDSNTINGKLNIDSQLSGSKAEIGINIRSLTGTDIYHISNRFLGEYVELKSQTMVEFSLQHQLISGSYAVCLYLKVNDVEQQWIENAATFEVPSEVPYGFLDASQIQADLTPEFTIKVL